MIFKLAWHDQERSTSMLFVGPDKTQKEWDDDCSKAIREVSDEYISEVMNEKTWATIDGWVEAAQRKLESYGYIPVQPTSFDVPITGSSIIGSVFCQDDPELDEWKNFVGEENFAQAEKWNKRFYSENC